MNRQQGMVLIIGMVILMLLTLLSLSYVEQAMWLQKLRRYIHASTVLQEDVTTLIKQLDKNPLAINCTQRSQRSSWLDDWQQVVWQKQRRCHAQIGATRTDYLVEFMPPYCWYYVWGIGKSPAELQQLPVALYRITLFAKNDRVQPLLTEIYIATPASGESKCTNFSHQIILGRQSRRHRGVQELY